MKQEIQIHKIATKNRSKIGLSNIYNKLMFCEESFFEDFNGILYNLYATVLQDVEPIKIGDWAVCDDGDRKAISQALTDDDLNAMSCIDSKKIIATTDDQLRINSTVRESDENSRNYGKTLNIIAKFQQSFVKEYCDKGGIYKALVKYDETFIRTERSIAFGIISVWNYNLKLNSDNTITVYPLEEKMYTLEDMEKSYDAGEEYGYESSPIEPHYLDRKSKTFDQFIEENL